MNIPSHMYRFSDENALLVATGKQAGRIFVAKDGKISEIGALSLPPKKYSDREGLFARSGNGRTYGFGSAYEPKDQEVKKKFLKAFSDKVEKAVDAKKPETIYLFSPNYEITELKDALALRTKNLIRFSFMGNYVKFAPDELLRKITARVEKLRDKTEVRSPEENKILSRPRERNGSLKKHIPRLKFA